jgi:hypothetical protein
MGCNLGMLLWSTSSSMLRAMPGLLADQAGALEGEHHLMDGRRGDAEEALQNARWRGLRDNCRPPSESCRRHSQAYLLHSGLLLGTRQTLYL